MRYWCWTILGVLAAAGAQADVRVRDFNDPDAPQWTEDSVQLPGYPGDKSLREFYVSETTSHRFFIDETSLSIGKDGVVRYVLVVRTRGGASNVTFEGIRCDSREFKHYATGRQDGSWAMVRKGEWRVIENKPINRHHAALFRDYLCPYGSPIRNPEEGREALRRSTGTQPDAILVK